MVLLDGILLYQEIRQGDKKIVLIGERHSHETCASDTSYTQTEKDNAVTISKFIDDVVGGSEGEMIDLFYENSLRPKGIASLTNSANLNMLYNTLTLIEKPYPTLRAHATDNRKKWTNFMTNKDDVITYTPRTTLSGDLKFTELLEWAQKDDGKKSCMTKTVNFFIENNILLKNLQKKSTFDIRYLIDHWIVITASDKKYKLKDYIIVLGMHAKRLNRTEEDTQKMFIEKYARLVDSMILDMHILFRMYINFNDSKNSRSKNIIVYTGAGHKNIKRILMKMPDCTEGRTIHRETSAHCLKMTPVYNGIPIALFKKGFFKDTKPRKKTKKKKRYGRVYGFTFSQYFSKDIDQTHLGNGKNRIRVCYDKENSFITSKDYVEDYILKPDSYPNRVSCPIAELDKHEILDEGILIDMKRNPSPCVLIRTKWVRKTYMTESNWYGLLECKDSDIDEKWRSICDLDKQDPSYSLEPTAISQPSLTTLFDVSTFTKLNIEEKYRKAHRKITESIKGGTDNINKNMTAILLMKFSRQLVLIWFGKDMKYINRKKITFHVHFMMKDHMRNNPDLDFLEISLNDFSTNNIKEYERTRKWHRDTVADDPIDFLCRYLLIEILTIWSRNDSGLDFKELALKLFDITVQ
jgi:hypothetical protein